mmetsp:Transcript_21214/g.41195  ORF Transcript_21214/g.41195 Transcript_21214/m.41195 type:complete len:224 (-) Transcript_21214:91-762(-)
MCPPVERARRSITDGFTLSTRVIPASRSASWAMRDTVCWTIRTSGLRLTILSTTIARCSCSWSSSVLSEDMRLPPPCVTCSPLNWIGELSSSTRGSFFLRIIFLCATFLRNTTPSMKRESVIWPPGMVLILTYARISSLSPQRTDALTLLTAVWHRRKMGSLQRRSTPSSATSLSRMNRRCASASRSRSFPPPSASLRGSTTGCCSGSNSGGMAVLFVSLRCS